MKFLKMPRDKIPSTYELAAMVVGIRRFDVLRLAGGRGDGMVAQRDAPMVRRAWSKIILAKVPDDYDD